MPGVETSCNKKTASYKHVFCQDNNSRGIVELVATNIYLESKLQISAG